MVVCCSALRSHDLVVLVSAAVIRLLINGLWYTPGILYVAFRDEFRFSAGVTSWITTLQYFTSCITCVLGGLVVRRYGSRLVTAAGGLILSCGLLTSMAASHIAHVFVTFGVLSGVGSGLSYIASMEALNVQFTDYRNILFAVCAFTGNLGILIYPPMLQSLINTYSWRGMFLVIGACELNIIVAAIVFPGRTKRSQKKNPQSTEKCQDGESNGQTALLCKECDNVPKWRDEEKVLSDISSGSGIKAEAELFKYPDKRVEISIKYPDKSVENSITKEVCSKDLNRFSSCSQCNSFINRNVFLTNRHYYLYLLSGALFMFGSGIILGHLSAFTILNKLTDKIGASTLYSVNVMSMATAKLIQGFVISNKCLQPVTLHIILTGMGGLVTFLFLLKMPLALLYVYVVAFGASNSSIGGALLPAITLNMSGGDNFAFSLGVCSCVHALGTLLGAPVAGWIYDATHSYVVPFMVAAIAMTSSAVVMIMSCYIKRISATTQLDSNL